MFMFIDTHVHLNNEQYDEDLAQVIARAFENNVKQMVVIGFDRPTIERALELADTYDFIYAAIGWHPVDAIDCTDEDLEWIEQLAKTHNKVVAIGETGLDYHWDKSPKEVQHDIFRKQIQLAKRVGLPIIIHNREATGDCVRILMEEHAEEVGGVMHSFSASVEVAETIIHKLNFYVGLGGPVTFKNAKTPKKVAAEIPLERIILETDAPFLAPHPNRGKRNEPSYIPLIAAEIAQLRGIDVSEVERVTTENAQRFYRIK
jgi:TatD DNase family protein